MYFASRLAPDGWSLGLFCLPGEEIFQAVFCVVLFHLPCFRCVCVYVRVIDAHVGAHSLTLVYFQVHHFLASQVLVRGGNRITMPLACIGIVGEKRQNSICFTLHCSLYIDFWFFEYGAMFFFSLGFYDFFSKAIFTHMKYYFKTSVSPSKAIFRRIEGVDTAEMLILIFYSLVSPLSRVKCNAERFPSGNPPHNVAHEWPNQEAATKLL